MSDKPKVSIIIPCYNEQATIQMLLSAICEQTFELENLEVIVADGMSTDHTRDEIKFFQENHPDLSIKIVDNPDRNIPSGLNKAIMASEGEYLVRLDAHSVPSKKYVELCVQALDDGLGQNVGGIWEIQASSEGWMSQSIAVAASHPLGVGDALYRVGGEPQTVDTVPFGAFKRSIVEQIGLFDESLLTNEDYEFNARIRKAGGKIWMDPSIKSTYFARSTLRELARQYWRYGYWKVRMLVRYPGTFRWRQLAGAFVLSWLVLGILSLRYPIALWLLFFETTIYGSVLTVSSALLASKHKDIYLFIGVPLAIATMHFSWGAAFLWSVGEIFFEKIVSRFRPNISDA
jgi:glycosyltransferase involved in cell wall biosynthesis